MRLFNPIMKIMFNPVSDGHALSEVMLNSLSEWITDESELRKLGITGLGVEDRFISKHLKDKHGDITSAVYSVLKEWRKKHPDDMEAWQDLHKALGDAGMSYYRNTLEPKKQ